MDPRARHCNAPSAHNDVRGSATGGGGPEDSAGRQGGLVSPRQQLESLMHEKYPEMACLLDESSDGSGSEPESLGALKHPMSPTLGNIGNWKADGRTAWGYHADRSSGGSNFSTSFKVEKLIAAGRTEVSQSTATSALAAKAASFSYQDHSSGQDAGNWNGTRSLMAIGGSGIQDERGRKSPLSHLHAGRAVTTVVGKTAKVSMTAGASVIHSDSSDRQLELNKTPGDTIPLEMAASGDGQLPQENHATKMHHQSESHLAASGSHSMLTVEDLEAAALVEASAAHTTPYSVPTGTVHDLQTTTPAMPATLVTPGSEWPEIPAAPAMGDSPQSAAPAPPTSTASGSFPRGLEHIDFLKLLKPGTVLRTPVPASQSEGSTASPAGSTRRGKASTADIVKRAMENFRFRESFRSGKLGGSLRVLQKELSGVDLLHGVPQSTRAASGSRRNSHRPSSGLLGSTQAAIQRSWSGVTSEWSTTSTGRGSEPGISRMRSGLSDGGSDPNDHAVASTAATAHGKEKEGEAEPTVHTD